MDCTEEDFMRELLIEKIAHNKERIAMSKETIREAEEAILLTEKVLLNLSENVGKVLSSKTSGSI